MNTQIAEDYCDFETAKLFKEKGFKGQGEHFYEDNKITNYINYWPRITPKQRYEAIEAPTLQMAMKWLREVHNLHIDVDPSEGDWNPTVLELENWTCAVKFGDKIPIQDSYEEACEAAIKYCLTNLI